MKNSLLKYGFFIAALLGPVIGLSGQVLDVEGGLILYLPFNGDAQDESGSEIPTDVLGPVLTSDKDGNPNSAYLFDGVDDYIRLNNNNPIITTQSFSICAWAKMNGQSNAERSQNVIFEQRDDEADKIRAQSTIVLVSEANNIVIFSLRGSTPSSAGSTDLNCNAPEYHNWYHYVSTIDENRITKIYINGKLCSTGSFAGVGDFNTSIDHVDIGTHQYRGLIKGAFNGVIDDVRIYSRALEYCEIEALYSGQQMQER